MCVTCMMIRVRYHLMGDQALPDCEADDGGWPNMPRNSDSTGLRYACVTEDSETLDRFENESYRLLHLNKRVE